VGSHVSDVSGQNGSFHVQAGGMGASGGGGHHIGRHGWFGSMGGPSGPPEAGPSGAPSGPFGGKGPAGLVGPVIGGGAPWPGEPLAPPVASIGGAPGTSNAGARSEGLPALRSGIDPLGALEPKSVDDEVPVSVEIDGAEGSIVKVGSCSGATTSGDASAFTTISTSPTKFSPTPPTMATPASKCLVLMTDPCLMIAMTGDRPRHCRRPRCARLANSKDVRSEARRADRLAAGGQALTVSLGVTDRVPPTPPYLVTDLVHLGEGVELWSRVRSIL
jgi:hypothetical protein